MDGAADLQNDRMIIEENVSDKKFPARASPKESNWLRIPQSHSRHLSAEADKNLCHLYFSNK
jgi:hypothetical protein